MSKSLERKSEALINENIKAPEVLVVNEKGESLGVKPIDIARRMAEEVNLDLVCVAPNAKIPVCRFMDYSKFRYEQQRKARESRKNQKIVTLKEIWVSPVISANDFETKLKNGRRFLSEGNKLKITLRFVRRMRMLSNENDYMQILNNFIERTQDIAYVESRPSLEGRNMSVILSPKKDK
ncbi:MAG: translation initiation factor IF-3 [Bacilli bacterium]|nr:translation initiation factor IF-3 [Acholeplasmataceae bacterium]HOA78246.1 translation initiation factor IF-3 [Bacilli bacterium]HPZ26965.1 translation initiation factor IF-3 [Bacilli bacterium]HQC89371.1 translation initiation factor IF-3 [Bacilli bacterium]